MTTIDLTIHKDRRARAIQRAKERNIIIPTYAQMKDPSKSLQKLKDELKSIGLWDIHPRNLFRINWHNQPSASGGTFSTAGGGVNFIELPSSLTGSKRALSSSLASGSRRERIKSGRRLAVWCRDWSQVSLTRQPKSSLAVHRQLLSRRRIRLRFAWM